MDVVVIACPFAHCSFQRVKLPFFNRSPCTVRSAQPLQLTSAHPAVMRCADFRVHEHCANCMAMLISAPEELMKQLARKYGK